MRSLVIPVYAVILGLGAVGLYLIEILFWQQWGWLGIIVGNLLFPVASIAAALYDGFANGDWTLALIAASGFVLFGILSIATPSSN